MSNSIPKGGDGGLGISAASHITPFDTMQVSGSAGIALSDGLQTAGQLMRTTSQDLQRLYREQLGHNPRKISCHLKDDKLFIWVEGSISRIERVVADSSDGEAQVIRSAIKNSLYKQIADIVENNLKVDVVTLVTDTCYKQECTIWAVLLTEAPKVRPSRRSQSR